MPKGKVTSYLALAKALNSSPRAVGQALRCNPFASKVLCTFEDPKIRRFFRAPIVPCHRVVSADGSIGGFMGKVKGKTIDKKIALLREEGVIVVDGVIKDFERVKFG